MPVLLAISSGLGLLTALIKVAESIYTGTGQGAEKKQTVLDLFFSFITAGVGSGFLRGDFKELAENAETLKPVVGTLIDGIVDLANTVGTFGDPKLEALSNQP